MTREEAIRIIRKMLACTDLSVRANLNADMVDACHLAIKALEQEPTNKNDLGVDCILRFSAEQLVRKEFCNIPSKIYNKLMVEFDELPSVTPKIEPKTGHWIDREVYDADRWKCSECGRTEQWKENFCPNCGAKMVEPQESEGKE